MRILIFTSIYDYLLNDLYNMQKKGFTGMSYDKLRKTIYEQHFGNADAYVYYFKKSGCAVEEFFENDLVSQRQWMREHTIRLPKLTKWTRLVKLKRREWQNRKYVPEREELFEIAKHQVRLCEPEVVLDRNVNFFPPEYLKAIKRNTKLLVAHISYKVMFPKTLKYYDVILTASHTLHRRFDRMGIPSEYVRHAFDKRVLKRIKRKKRKYQVVFVGGLEVEEHKPRIELLTKLANHVPVKIWAKKGTFLKRKRLKKRWKCEVWGGEMYNILANSKIVLNCHSTVAGEYAGNMRMFEATGVGSLLLTDEKKNNGEFFETDKEIITYKNWQEAVKKIRYYLRHEDRRREIARNGQKRTLQDHTYKKRIQEMLDICTKYLP